eukprot:CAMPEP_0196592406 /NCGR_PEP_ID=MMETSP1081-20130531/72667_1 /TAXON_ID=36882 /ORGANISM="Pyramimonas amylifera, Strain CCMP720" /LENGTH=429 /DNA_ID=CAMNT_0041916097 /DNA_START=127 /DNA_END=1416 /DNA_ORIENTATION=-
MVKENKNEGKSQSSFSSSDKDHKIIVIDNGGGNLKVGIAGLPESIRVLPNYIAKPKTDKKSYFGDQVNEIKDVSAINLKRPIEKGYVTNWDILRDIWAHVFKHLLKVDTKQCSLLVTEPLFNLPVLQSAMEELVFSEFKFLRVCFANTPELSFRHALLSDPGIPWDAAQAKCGLVLDTGFSFTHAVPIFDGRVILEGVRRINLGGKALTNYLKELVSFRAWNMMDEYLIIDDVKEKLCYVTQDLAASLVSARLPGANNPVRRCYVLPDGLTHTRGFVKEIDPAEVQNQLKRKKLESENEEEQLLTLTNERFTVPEALFHPSDIGVMQAGLAETIIQAIAICPEEMHEIMYSNVICTGGCSTIPGFVDRLYQDLRPLAPCEYELQVRISKNPVECAWRGGSDLATSKQYSKVATSHETYKKIGSRAIQTS